VSLSCQFGGKFTVCMLLCDLCTCVPQCVYLVHGHELYLFTRLFITAGWSGVARPLFFFYIYIWTSKYKKNGLVTPDYYYALEHCSNIKPICLLCSKLCLAWQLMLFDNVKIDQFAINVVEFYHSPSDLSTLQPLLI